MIEEPTSNFCAFDREIDVLDPYSFEPTLADVIRALPKINRFNGQTNRPYSVAMHSIMCVEAAIRFYNITELHKLLAILLHDAGEAYIGDIVRPIKQNFNGELVKIEEIIVSRVLKLFDFSVQEMAEINSDEFKTVLSEIDTRMGVTEADELLEITILPEIKRFKDLKIHKTNSWKVDEKLFASMILEIYLRQEFINKGK